jgi:hypothetical protein
MEEGGMAIGRKDTTPLLEVHRKAPEATPRLQLGVEFRRAAQDEARMRECSRAWRPETAKSAPNLR